VYAYLPSVRLLFALTLLSSWYMTSIGRAHEVEAIAGEPFGVGKMTVQLDSDVTLAPDTPRQLVERQGRVLYPAFDGAGVEGAAESDRLTVCFLFRGNRPRCAF